MKIFETENVPAEGALSNLKPRGTNSKFVAFTSLGKIPVNSNSPLA